MLNKYFYRLYLFLLGVTFVTIEASLYYIFILSPVEETMGIIQKIFYFHVASAWLSFFSFFIVFISSIIFLWKKEKIWDIVAHSSAEIGIIFCTIVLITGPIWARPIWNAWWSWDARLTTTLVLWMIYMAYIFIRPFTENEVKGAKASAVFGIIGFIDVPIVYMSIRWWRTIHPQAVIASKKGGLDPVMLKTLIISIIGFTFLYLSVIILNVSIDLIKDELENKK
ncbi:MAG: cytochrome c biogenesis protein CcsA [bacterium]